MTNILLGIYFLIVGSITLFSLTVDPKFMGLLALIIGLALLLAPYAGRFKQ